MNSFTFNEISVNHTESFSKSITKEDVDLFLTITGDTNPLHTDERFAQEQLFSGKVVYGMLSASLLSTLAGVYLPGKYSLILSVKTDFLKPVFVNDTLLVEGTVAQKKEFGNIIELSVLMTNQRKEKVLRGTMIIKVLK